MYKRSNTKNGNTLLFCDGCGKHHVELGINLSLFTTFKISLGDARDMFGSPMDFEMVTHSCSKTCDVKAKAKLNENWMYFIENNPETFEQLARESETRARKELAHKLASIEISTELFYNGGLRDRSKVTECEGFKYITTSN